MVSEVVKLFLVVGREGPFQKVQLGRFRLQGRNKKSPSKGNVVVQEVTQRESGSAHGSGFQGMANESGETSVKT